MPELYVVADTRFEWVALRVFDGIEGEVHIEIRPVEMAWLRTFNVVDGLNGSRFEPRKKVEGKKELAIVNQHPESVLGNVGYFSVRSAHSKPLGSLVDAP